MYREISYQKKASGRKNTSQFHITNTHGEAVKQIATRKQQLHIQLDFIALWQSCFSSQIIVK
jgi:hypothetical protein